MEMIQLAEKKKAFAPPETRYQHPFKEAMKLGELWRTHKLLSKRQEIRESKRLLREASNLLKEGEKLERVYRLINKGLFYNPSFHPLHALKGDVHLLQGKWTKAIKNYENAKSMAKFDSALSRGKLKTIYNDHLIDAYVKRGDWYYRNNLLLEALGDYEQIFIYKLPGIHITKIQDRLLEILRKLLKYDMFRRYWDKFIMNPDPLRTSALLSMHAEYKIYLGETELARHMLLKALALNKDNEQAQELLQVIFSTSHTLAAYTVIWCMHNCYDKALITVEKALGCNPYNPGFTLLKTIVLRLSGRFEEANSWLESLSNNFYKLLEPTRDKEKSIMGKFSISETRDLLIKQWYLIRYDMSLKCMLEDKLDMAIRIIYKSNLVKHYAEPYILLGDCFVKRKDIDLALKSYLKCREKIRQLNLPVSRKTIDLTERIIDILNDKAEAAVNKGHSKRTIDIVNQALRILHEDGIPLEELRIQRGRALLYKARSQFQIENKQNMRKKQSCETAADSLRFVRELNEDLYQALYDDKDIEEVIDRFAPTRKLPKSLKIFMQFS
ncbi:hypothetical protein WN48_09495 [Eufriesea mexicana]|nr:hypothetical protein WN48_09495 [Eufriesea mexicana]